MTLSVKRDAVQLSVLDRENQAMAGLRIRAVLQRPTDEAGDQVLKLQETGAGIYRTEAAIGGGVWVADITAEKTNNELVRFVQRIFVK